MRLLLFLILPVLLLEEGSFLTDYHTRYPSIQNVSNHHSTLRVLYLLIQIIKHLCGKELAHRHFQTVTELLD